MRHFIVTTLLVLFVASAKAAEPTLADATADFDAGRCSTALTKISRILAGSAAKAGNTQRYDLFMLRGQCLLQNRSSRQAATAFAAAFGEVDFAADPTKAAAARAMMILTKASPRGVYQPNNDAPPIDIVAADFRQRAFAALLEQRFTAAEPQMQAAIDSSSLLPTKSLLPTLADSYAIELLSTGDVVRTGAAIQAFDGHARDLLDAELRRIQTRVDELHDLANQATLSDSPRQQLSYRGLTSPQRDELRTLADSLVEVQKVIGDGDGINKSIGADVQPWKTLMERCNSIAATADQAFKRSY